MNPDNREALEHRSHPMKQSVERNARRFDYTLVELVLAYLAVSVLLGAYLEAIFTTALLALPVALIMLGKRTGYSLLLAISLIT